MRKFYLPLCLFLVTAAYLGVVIATQWSVFATTYPVATYESMYGRSQYVMGEGRTHVMGDSDIYTYAGIRYMQGEDVTRVNFEHTPLVKYLFGASYLATGKPNWVLVPLTFVAVFAFWYLTGIIIQPLWGRLAALALFLGHSTIVTNLPQTMLDFPMTTFLLVTAVAYHRVLIKATLARSLLFGFTAGLLLLCKYPFPLQALYVGFLFVYLFVRATPRHFLVSAAAVMLTTYMAGYWSYFINHHSFLDFLKFEWWRWHWFSGKTDNPKGMIWQTLFLGRYPKWWTYTGEYVYLKQWNLLWPVTVSLYGLSFLVPLRRQLHALFPYKVWVAVALGAYSLGVAEDRFLIPLIPGFALFGASLLVGIVSRYKGMKIRRLSGL